MNTKNVLIVGGGISGVGAAKLANKLNYNICVTSTKKIDKKYRNVLIELGAQIEEGLQKIEQLKQIDLIIKSPGVPQNIDLLNNARKQDIPIISEMEFAYSHTDSKIIAVTGTNGKTTTSSMLFHILSEAGFSVALVGNIGKSFSESIVENIVDHYVVEVSSFQLEDIIQFKPDISIILNLTKDHLDRYDNFQDYIDTKLKIQMNQSESDLFIYFSKDKNIRPYLEKIKSQQYSFGDSKPVYTSYGAWIEKDKIIINTKKNNFNMTIHNLALQGTHNIYNSMAASIAATSLGIKDNVIKKSLANFKGVEHRLEFVAKVSGVNFINDSKATNCNAVYYALDSVHSPIIWICGGIDKGNNYTPLKKFVEDKVKSIVYLGNNPKKIESAFKSSVQDIVVVNTMKDAVRASYLNADAGDTVLLSPACASFDLFASYEERGHAFKSSVLEI
ncbi:MAG: UDP-N-acetylmuramoyl-L-alanine--D-glutamate ligase [Flavobacteriales bacterium]|jgi:UDP-N-acetylmuramoylalanine--D-glutamate ligase|nr:UDP-N-acetylmuramoyl-L-alanine--D-glutamate ligase [Flavobacteriales bacterium]